MLRIEKVFLQGFKSFCDPTEVVFDEEGITAVVGPNGCGKSNISDAINWVIGEQRARALRGGKMEDVIFQGSRNRQPAGMAEVLLTMVVRETFEIRSDNGRKSAGEALASEATQETGEDGQPQPESPTAEETAGETSAETSAETSTGAAPTTAAESESKQAESAKKRRRMTIEPASRVFQEGERITVGRRLYRTGESEYEMNGRACRLRDIQDLFAGTGLGGAHYAIIEQGRIGQVLSAKPLDRRALIEEAAGISKFKMRQHAAELKLEASRQNLSRVNDIISEIERQQNSLKRQAARARRYQRLRQEMRDLMRAVYVCDYRATKSALAALESDWEAASGRETAAIERIAGLEATHSQSAQEARGAEEKLNATRSAAASLDLETERARQQERYLSEQLRSLEARAEESARERETIAGRSGFIEQERARLGDELQAVEQELNAAGLALSSDEDAHRAQLARDREAEEQLEAARRLLYETTTHLERWRQLCRQFDEAVDRGETRLSGLAAERERTEAQAKANDAERERLEASRAEGEARHTEVVEQLAVIEAELGEAREVRAGREQALATVKHDLTATEHRLKSLIELDERHACFSEAVQLLLNRAQNRDLNDGNPPPFRALGTLADFVRVAPEHEAMIETALREELQYILVPGYDDAIAAIDLLKSEGAGRASFLLVGLHGAEGPATIASSDLDGEDRQPADPDNNILDSQSAGPVDNLLDLQPEEPADSTLDSQPAENGDGILDSESGAPGEDPVDPLFAPAHQAEFAAEVPEASTFTDEERDAGPGDADRGIEHPALIDLLGLQPELASIFERALPRLAGARIVETVEQAIGASIAEPDSGAEGREAANGAAPSEIYVTRQGERVIAGRLVMGGANASSGIGVLAMKREMAELGERYESLSNAARTAGSELEAADARLRSLEERRSALDAEQRQIEKQLAVLRTQWEQSERDRERISTHLRVIAQETAQVEKELAEQRNRLVQATAQTEVVEREHREAEQSVASAQAEMVELRRRSEERAQELSRRRAEFAARAERRRGLQNDINRLENEARDLTDRLERSRLSTIETEEQIKTLKANLAATSEQLAALASRQQEMAAALAEENAALSAMRERLEALDQELRAARDESTAAREERARLELERVRLTSLLDHLADSCYHELGERLSSILERLEAGTADASLETSEETGARSEMIEDEEAEEAEAPGLSFWQVPEDFDLEAAKVRLEELRAKIDALGPINMMALDELTEVEERYRFLVAQKADIERAIADTQSAIAEIKRRSRERFAEAFAAINTNFQQMFQELFGGGRGEMRLIDETDILESGIEIIAQPPGKRLQNVLLLSGGEKAMAAISLVLAIFKYRPSPFCILDEVDAPLDEVNITRFADKVREMSVQTQFVIITHSKRTMEAARTLYGVTMEDPGVSKLISVRLT